MRSGRSVESFGTSVSSSPASGSASPTSFHHPGSVVDFDSEKFRCALSEYVKEFDDATLAFDLGIYNRIKKSQSVKGDGILCLTKLIQAALTCLPGLRFKPTQLQAELEQLDGQHSCNGTGKTRGDWARATNAVAECGAKSCTKNSKRSAVCPVLDENSPGEQGRAERAAEHDLRALSDEDTNTSC